MSATGPYTVQYDPKALKELTKLDKPAARRIVKAIDALSVGPRPSGARPLVGYPDLWRIRVGDYRVGTRPNPTRRGRRPPGRRPSGRATAGAPPGRGRAGARPAPGQGETSQPVEWVPT